MVTSAEERDLNWSSFAAGMRRSTPVSGVGGRDIKKAPVAMARRGGLVAVCRGQEHLLEVISPPERDYMRTYSNSIG